MNRVSESILDRLAQRQGTSVIRIGDGEGVVLSRSAHGNSRLERYLATHFGPGVTQAQLDRLTAHLAAAVNRANVIGLRNDVRAPGFTADPLGVDPDDLVTWARDHLSLRPEEHASLDPESALRLVLLGRWMEGFPWPEKAMLTTAWIHFDWLESGFLAELALRESHIGLVTGRPELAAVFNAAGITVDEWRVPLRHLRRDEAWTPHFPDRYEELLDTLVPAFPGQVFFVGAGICGKIYCDVIARRGGIALDIGAVCDAWLGFPTRPRVARFRWGQDEVPTSLLLHRQLEGQASASGNGEEHAR